MNNKETRIFIACGAAAGVTAAFNAPIAGVVFTQKEAQSFWSKFVTLRVFLTTTLTGTSLSLFQRLIFVLVSRSYIQISVYNI